MLFIVILLLVKGSNGKRNGSGPCADAHSDCVEYQMNNSQHSKIRGFITMKLIQNQRQHARPAIVDQGFHRMIQHHKKLHDIHTSMGTYTQNRMGQGSTHSIPIENDRPR